MHFKGLKYTSFKNIPNFYFFFLTFSLKLNYEGVGTFFSVSIYKNWSKINIKEVLAYKYWYCVTPRHVWEGKEHHCLLIEKQGQNRDDGQIPGRIFILWSTVWDPHTKNNIDKVELLQRRAGIG